MSGAISGVQILHLRQFFTVNHRTMCSQLLDELEALTTHIRVSGPPPPPPPAPPARGGRRLGRSPCSPQAGPGAVPLRPCLQTCFGARGTREDDYHAIAREVSIPALIPCEQEKNTSENLHACVHCTSNQGHLQTM